MVRILLVVIACEIALYLAWRVREVIRLAAISVFLALAINPLVDAVDRRIRVSRALIILAIYVVLTYMVLTAGVVVVGDVVVPSMVKEVGQLSRNAPQYARDLRSNSTFRHYDNRYHISAKLVQDARNLPQGLAHLAGPLKQVTVQAFSFIGQLVTVLALTFLLVLRPRVPEHGPFADRGWPRAISAPDHRNQRGGGEVRPGQHGDRRTGHSGNVDCAIDPRRPLRATARVRCRILRPDTPRRGYARRDHCGIGHGDGELPPRHYRVGRIHHRLAALRGLRRPAARLRASLHVNPLVTIVSVLAGAEPLGILGALIAIPTAAAIQIVLRYWWASCSDERTAVAQ
jgi:AI-2E family transporter